MNIQEKKDRLLLDIKDYESRIEKIKEELDLLNNSVELDFKDLIKEYETNNNNYFTIEKRESEYNYILGGDGRSSPWDERRKGLCLFVNYKGIYISRDNINKLEKYIEATKDNDIKHIFINTP